MKKRILFSLIGIQTCMALAYANIAAAFPPTLVDEARFYSVTTADVDGDGKAEMEAAFPGDVFQKETPAPIKPSGQGSARQQVTGHQACQLVQAASGQGQGSTGLDEFIGSY